MQMRNTHIPSRHSQVTITEGLHFLSRVKVFWVNAEVEEWRSRLVKWFATSPNSQIPPSLVSCLVTSQMMETFRSMFVTFVVQFSVIKYLIINIECYERANNLFYSFKVFINAFTFPAGVVTRHDPGHERSTFHCVSSLFETKLCS